MFCLYQNSNVTWQGTKPDAALNKLLGVTLAKDAFRRATPEELATFEIYRLQRAPHTSGKITTVTNHLRDGLIVSEVFDQIDDPNYVAPVPPTDEEILADARSAKVCEIKRVAGEMILEILPAWKQDTMALLGRDAWTDEELLAFGELNRIRAKSDEIELSVSGMTIEQIQELDVTDGGVWADVPISE